ncbi:hypothetical protein WJX73_000913 [Symbiochloris irregularis]|uniref:F-box domain-containing protein n=1 Tax=Symbiochloris irregularis TaxID=706552 RepID=A0AAW1NVR3_9CHLO
MSGGGSEALLALKKEKRYFDRLYHRDLAIKDFRSATKKIRSMDGVPPCISLLDHRLRMPLEEGIVPRLSPEAVGRLACTCRYLRSLLYGDLLENQWWRDVASVRLGPTHPALLVDSPDASTLRAAMSQCTRASDRMKKAGDYTLAPG